MFLIILCCVHVCARAKTHVSVRGQCTQNWRSPSPAWVLGLNPGQQACGQVTFPVKTSY